MLSSFRSPLPWRATLSSLFLKPRSTCSFSVFLSPYRSFSSSVETTTTTVQPTSSTNTDWEVIIGLEIHAQVTANTKLFSAGATSFEEEPNSRVSFHDAAIPGTLPVINQRCIEQSVKTALALNGNISLSSSFDRKHYFYCDLPAGYQITQQFRPIMSQGKLRLQNGKEVRISALKLEQDSGKSLHEQHPFLTYLDLNRAGSALMEIVSEPDLRSSTEAGEYVGKLQHLLRWIETCDANMDEGSMRCDANVSVRRPGEPFGTRCEIKNLNSIKFLIKAIDYEVARQIEIREQGQRVAQETRGFDAKKNVTYRMRTKEDEVDYRYMPEPDLPPLVLSEKYIEQIRSSLPSLPDEVRQRFLTEYQLSAYDTDVLINEPGAAMFFDASLKEGKGKVKPKFMASWLMTYLFGILHNQSKSFLDSPAAITPNQFATLVGLVDEGRVSKANGKKVLVLIVENGDKRAPLEIIEEKGWSVLQDDQVLTELIKGVLTSNPESVVKFHKGGTNEKSVLKNLTGQVLRAANGKASPVRAQSLLESLLRSTKPE